MEDIVSKTVLRTFTLVNFIYLYPIVSLSGVITNIINIIVFSQMNLKDTVNISLLSLSICDFFMLIFSFLISIFYNPVMEHSNLAFKPSDIRSLILGRPYSCFKRISNWILAFITYERCLCIVQPFKVHKIITPRRSVAIMLIITAIIAVTATPMYIAAHYQFKLSTTKNISFLSSSYANQILYMESLSTGISFGLTILTFFWVSICTGILVFSLNGSRNWRVEAMVNLTISTRDTKVIKMVTFLLLIFIIAFVPDCIVLFAQTIEPELSLSGKYKNLQSVLLGVTETLLAIHASVNIVVYLKMSTKYRKTFLFCFCKIKQFI